MSLNSRHSPFSVRGAIEGFYGQPFSWAERCRLVSFMGERGMNRYVYAPKNDPLHREAWREAYPPEDIASFRMLADAGAAVGVGIVYAVAPGLSYDAGTPRDFTLLETKLASLLDAGATGVALLFDDITPDSTAVDPDVQAELIARVAASVAARRRDADFWFVGNFYTGTADDLLGDRGFFASLYPHSARDYFAAYAERVAPEIPIMWTGPGVFSARITARDAATFRELAARPVVLWDNFPVNDAMPRHLFLGPYQGREAAIHESMIGVVVNLMGQASANRLPLATAAEFLAAPHSYDPQRSFAAALQEIGGPDGAALAILAEHHRGHPVLAPDDGADRLAARTRAAFAARGAAPEAAAELRAELDDLARNHARLRREVADEDLLRELAPWSTKLSALAEAALLGLGAMAGAVSVEEYERCRAAAVALPEVVAATPLPPPLVPFCVGGGEAVDRFAELFAAIDGALA